MLIYFFFSYFCKSQLQLEKLLEGLPASTNLLLAGEAQMFPRLALLPLPPGDVLLLRDLRRGRQWWEGKRKEKKSSN